MARHPDSPDIRRIERAAGRVPTLAEAFAADPGRAGRFSFAHGGVWIDFSMQHLTDELLSALVDLARTAGVEEKRDAMLRGDAVNVTEGRKVLHTALRSGDDTAEARLAAAQLGRAAALAERLRSDPGVRAVVNIGIGGSDLGPVMAHRALRAHRNGPECRFVSNIDPADLDDALHGLDPAATVFVVASKTFTTQETMHNAGRAREWVRSALGEAWATRFVATTAEPARAAQWGVPADQCLEFWDWVGGRFSLASVIGFPVMMAVGPARFAELLAGMRSMDAHFSTTPLASNIPVLHALIAWMNTTVFSRPTCAVVPYSHDLARVPAYLQQLVMESNGKSVGIDGHEVMHQTSPVIWGDAGTNGQHAFFQLLHQGTRVVPVDFIGVREPTGNDRAAHDMLVANMIAQAAALALGRPGAQEPHRVFPGNRPSTTILMDDLSPRSLGEIIAMYEHSTAVQGWLFGINSFDQFGVELGKELATALLPEVQGGPPGPGTSATRAAVNKYRSR